MMIDLSIHEAAELLRRKEVSPVELTTGCLNKIDHLNSTLNAFITVTAEAAMEQARIAEAEIQDGSWRGPLHGIPIGLKDLIDTATIKTTCASELFADRVPTEDAEVVRRLKRAGAVILGKQNLQEFAWGGTSASSHYGPVHNPWDLERIAGGSSGGSAAAVAARLCFGAIGTDTGGSIREPAAFCGIAGLKPTYGRVSTRGVFPLSSSLDHVGPLCRSVADIAIMLEAIAGYDALDPNSVDHPAEKYSDALEATERYRVGIARRMFFEDLDPEIALAVDKALKVVSRVTLELVEVNLPDVPATVQAPEVFAVHKQYYERSSHLYGRWMRERLQQATSIDTTAYTEGCQEMQRLRRSVNDVFRNVDFVLTPTTPVPPITIAEAVDMQLPGPTGELWLRNTRPFNFYGWPTISIPCGFTTAGLPIGLQIAAAPFAESRLLAFAQAFEQATNWHNRSPKL